MLKYIKTKMKIQINTQDGVSPCQLMPDGGEL